jgi:hypothetical protein
LGHLAQADPSVKNRGKFLWTGDGVVNLVRIVRRYAKAQAKFQLPEGCLFGMGCCDVFQAAAP